MSRRKQARPIRLLDDPAPPSTPQPANGESSSGSDEETPASEGGIGPSCPQCGSEFPGYAELAEHSKLCLLGEEGSKTDEARRQDAENNNSLEEEEQAVFFGSPGHVTLEALQNTKVAVAQFAATAMANNADNPAALQELAVLQSTLYTLQHQQMMQLNLIQQLQQQLQIGRPKPELSPSSPKRSRSPTPVKPESPPPTQVLPPSPPPVSVPATLHPSPPVSLPPCSISSSFASSIITNLDPPPSPSEPNTLEMLQRRAQEVLDNASQGLLANNLADELAFRKSGGKGGSPYDSKSGGRNEPFFKHRCRYCGKVFGSDSALQIHIRSHTGERPFKCNVCGSRFTTKGNLKVHFQRHSAKFPHIKMNPNPIPEHLDKYHPPLLAQMGAHQSLPPGPPPFPPQFSPLYRPPHDLVLPPQRTHDPANKPILPVTVFGPRLEQEMPENLSKVSTESAPSQTELEDYKREPADEDPREDRLTPKGEMEPEGEIERYPSPPGYDDCSLDSSKYTCEDIPVDRDSPGMEKNEDSFQDQPENLSNKMNGEKSPIERGCGSPFSTERTRESPAISESSTSLGALDLTPRSSNSSGIFPGFFPPHSSSGGGPPLITSALSSLTSSVLTTTAFNPLGLAVGPPVRGNTTCNLCFKTFACNSALEIHYRSHTKERPFKCTICDRGFSTKGNMKQHMLTHKIRDMPPHLFEQKSGSNPAGHGGNCPGGMSEVPLSASQPLPPSPVHQQQQACIPPPPPQQQQCHPQHQQQCHPQQQQTPPLQPQQPPPPPPPQQPPPSQPLPQQPPPPPPPVSQEQQTQPTPDLLPPLQPPSGSPVQPKPEIGVKRSPPQGDATSMPLPKRQPSLPKHLCHVCNKNFSSSSALQIHMRTHTGDKPFRCSICQKAFTTKGNLKVHMGTHMWTNGASRRGRRMSLELPQLPKDTEFLHRRPDLFYPYLPAPFLNGIHQKLSEMPMSGGTPGSGPHNGMMAFPGYPPEGLKGEARSSPEKQGPTPPTLWDLHFERKPVSEEQPMPPPQRGEGLAA